MLPSALIGTTAAFATVCPATKLRVETGGSALPFGHRTRNPGPVVFVTVAFREIACASAGMPQAPSST